MVTKRSTRGKLLVFEGPDGVGKTSISQEIATYLNERGEACELMTFPDREPGTIGKLVYNLHHEPSKYGVESFTPTSKQALHIVAHLDAIERRIIPTIKAGRHIVLDRYWWSTWVYGRVAGINRNVLESMIDLERKQWQDVKPTLAILLRRQTPINRDDDLGEWGRLRREYDWLAEKEQEHYPVFTFDNVGSLKDAIDDIKAVLEERLNTSYQKSAHKNTPLDGQLSLDFANYGKSKSSDSINIVAYSRLLPAKPTVVFDTYWRFATERQKVFFKKLVGEPMPWTNDPILSTFKFTNAYRASDRTSQYLIRHVIYRDDLPSTPEEVFFRIILFKIFNKIETWQLLEKKLGKILHAEYSFKRYDEVLTETLEQSQTIYSAAYIMPSGGKTLGHTRKHRNHLRLIERMMADELPKKLTDAPNMHQGFDLLREYPTIGNFLAYQFITDVNYSEITHFDEMSFVVPGPGALDGIRKCFADLCGLNEQEIIKFMAENQDSEFKRLGLDFQNLFGRPLQLIDCQNLFCEVDKYARIKHPEISGISGRTRIKQKYSVAKKPVVYWFPPKWGINEAVDEYRKNELIPMRK
jgi:thymidylate kinase